jgi:hypothetical protein
MTPAIQGHGLTHRFGDDPAAGHAAAGGRGRGADLRLRRPSPGDCGAPAASG